MVRSRHPRLTSAATLLLLAAQPTLAQSVLIDFGANGSFRGVSAPSPDANSNYWNSLIPGFYYTDLTTTANTSSGINFGFSTPVGTDSFNGPAGATSTPIDQAQIDATDIDTAALGILGVREAAIDYAASDASSGFACRFEIQNLNPSLTYSLTFFASHKFTTDSHTIFSVFSDNTYSSLVATGQLQVRDPDMPWLHNRDTTLTFSNLAPQTSNILYVQFNGNDGGSGYLNDLLITAAPPASPTYTNTGSGQFDSAANWANVPNGAPYPNGVDARAVFASSILADAVVHTETDITLGRLDFNSAFQYDLAGPGRLTMQAATGAAQINVADGNHKLSLPVSLASNLDITTAASTALTISSPVSIPGTLTVTKAGPGTLVLTSVTIDPAGKLFVEAGNIAIDYTSESPIADLIAYLATAQLEAPGDFNGLPTTLAIAEASDLGLTTLGSAAIDETTVIIKYTYVGDANLDGQVDALDYERVDLAIGNSGVFGTAQGDLNYDGQVDALDYEQIDLNIGNGVGSPLAAIVVPEPAWVATPAIALLFTGRRRSRR